MHEPAENEQLRRVRERFTRTVDDFARFALSKRGVEADRLAKMTFAGFSAPVRSALDVACGPGTFARSFAPNAQFVLGLDYTAAMLAKARQAMVEASFGNVSFARADGNRLPLPDASLDIAVCGYSFHHFTDPMHLLHEMARVVPRGGRVAVADIFVPEGCDADANNRIERARDVSHQSTLTIAELRSFFDRAGLAILAAESDERPREYDDWMRNVSRAPGSAVYQSTRELLEAQIGRDTTGFRPRWKSEVGGAIEFVQPSCFIVGEKL